MNLIHFPSTHWTRLEQEGETAGGREWFCLTYRPAVLGYLRMKMEHHEAEDVCQDFFAKVVLDGDLMMKADQTRGRLRNLLLRALERFLSKQRRKAGAEKRGGLVEHWSLDALAPLSVRLEDFSAITPDHAFDRAWAAALMERALAATREDCRRLNKLPLFEALRPLLDGSGPARAHADLAGELGITARDVTLALCRLRRRVASHLYAEVTLTVQGKESVQDEWESVRQALKM